MAGGLKHHSGNHYSIMENVSLTFRTIGFVVQIGNDVCIIRSMCNALDFLWTWSYFAYHHI